MNKPAGFLFLIGISFLNNRDKNNHGLNGRLFSLKYLIWSFLLSLTGLGIVVYLTYTPGVLEHLKPKRLPGLGIAFMVVMLRIWVLAAKFRFLSDRELSWPASFRVILTWEFASAIMPSAVGGTPLATMAMNREGLKFGKSAAVALYGVLMDQILIVLLIPLLLFLGLFFDIIPDQYGMVGEASMFFIYATLLVHASILTYGIFVNPSALKNLLKKIFKYRLLKRFRNKVYEEAEYLEDSSRELKKKPASFLIKAFLYSAAAWILRFGVPTIVILSLLPANELLSLIRSMAMHLAFMIVPTPGGSGGIEGLFAIFQGPLIEREAFIGLAVFAWRIIGYYITVIMGMMAASWYVNKQVVEITNH